MKKALHRPKQLMSLLDNYKPLIAAMAFLICSIGAKAQIHQPATLWGKEERRLLVTIAMQGPTGNGNPSGSNITQREFFGFYFDSTNNRLFVYNPKLNTWDSIHVGASIGSVETASNGLTKTGNDIKLGGPLTGNTTIAMGGFNLTFSGNGIIDIPNTTSSVTGVITKGGTYFIHNYQPPGVDGDNLFIGKQAGNLLTMSGSGSNSSYNLGVGNGALLNLTTGNRNTALGIYAGQFNTSGINNTAVGTTAMWLNTTGYNHTIVGARALAFGATSHDVTAVGLDAASRGGNGAAYIVAIGTDALYNLWNGKQSVAIGDSTLWVDSTSFNNVAIGNRAGYGLGDTYLNFATRHDTAMTFVGSYATRDSSISGDTPLYNSTALGNNSKVRASNQMSFGDDNILTNIFKGNVGIGTWTPLKVLHTVGTVRHASLGTASGDTTTYKPTGINSSGDIVPMTYWPSGGGGSQTPWTSNINADGYTLFGNDGLGQDLTLGSTSHATKGKILFGTSAYDEVNNRLGINSSSPNVQIHAIEDAVNNVPPTLGTASGILALVANGNLYGTFFGTRHNTGEGWIQQMRRDGTGTSYPLLLQPSGNNVGIGFTTAPAEKLDVVGNIKASSKVMARNVIHTTSSQSTSFTAVPGNAYILADPVAPSYTVTLPASPSNSDVIEIWVSAITGGAWDTDVAYVKLDGTTSTTLAPNSWNRLTWDGSNWRILIQL